MMGGRESSGNRPETRCVSQRRHQPSWLSSEAIRRRIGGTSRARTVDGTSASPFGAGSRVNAGSPEVLGEDSPGSRNLKRTIHDAHCPRGRRSPTAPDASPRCRSVRPCHRVVQRSVRGRPRQRTRVDARFVRRGCCVRSRSRAPAIDGAGMSVGAEHPLENGCSRSTGPSESRNFPGSGVKGPVSRGGR